MPSTFGIVSSAATLAHPSLVLPSTGMTTSTYDADGWRYLIITSSDENSGLFVTTPVPGYFEFVVIAAGGGGGGGASNASGGGGGGGGVFTGNFTTASPTAPITVQVSSSGGAGGATNTAGSQGSYSRFAYYPNTTIFFATGGGGGGGSNTSLATRDRKAHV